MVIRLRVILAASGLLITLLMLPLFVMDGNQAKRALAQIGSFTVYPQAGGCAMSKWTGPNDTPTGKAAATYLLPSVEFVWWLDFDQSWPNYAIDLSLTTHNIDPILLKGNPIPESDVRVTTDKLSYRHGEKIVATIRNNHSVPIYGQSGQTYCSIVSVQRKMDDQWRMQRGCVAAGGPPGFIAIEAGSDITIEIFSQFPSDRLLDPGRYRIEFNFFVGSIDGVREIVHSNEFVIT